MCIHTRQRKISISEGKKINNSKRENNIWQCFLRSFIFFLFINIYGAKQRLTCSLLMLSTWGRQWTKELACSDQNWFQNEFQSHFGWSEGAEIEKHVGIYTHTHKYIFNQWVVFVWPLFFYLQCQDGSKETVYFCHCHKPTPCKTYLVRWNRPVHTGSGTNTYTHKYTALKS